MIARPAPAGAPAPDTLAPDLGAPPCAFISSSTNGWQSEHRPWSGATERQIARALARESETLLRFLRSRQDLIGDLIPVAEGYVECRTELDEAGEVCLYRLTLRRKGA